MTFESAIAALGDELGFDLPVEEGVARLEASGVEEDEDGIVVELSDMPDMGGMLLSSQVGDVAYVDDLRSLLEANHAFAETAGGALSIEDGSVYFEQCLPLYLVERGEGETAVKTFIASALEWRRRIDNMGGDGDEAADQPSPSALDGLTV